MAELRKRVVKSSDTETETENPNPEESDAVIPFFEFIPSIIFILPIHLKIECGP